MQTRPLPATPNVHPRTFLLVTWLASWIIWIPLALSHLGVVPLEIPSGTVTLISFLGVISPGIVALIMCARLKAAGQLLRPLRKWRVGWRWWAASALVWPAILVFAAGASNLFWEDAPIVAEPVSSASAFIVNIVFLLLATLGEELGWRGLALPGLENRYSALRSSVILGVVWATWHVPYWLLQDTYTSYGIAYVALSFLFVLAGTFYITWFYNHGQFSLLLPIVFHVSFNIVNVALLPVTSNMSAFAILVALDCVLAIIVGRRLETSKSIAVAPA